MWRQHDREVKNLNISINLKTSMKQKTVFIKMKPTRKKNPKIKSMRNLFKISPNNNLGPANSVCDYYFKIRKTYNIHAV